MSEFTRTVGRISYNGYSFRLYENKDGSATLKPVKNGHDLPKINWRTFKNLEEAECKIDEWAGEDSEGVQPSSKFN